MVAAGKKIAPAVEVLDSRNRKSPALAFAVARKANYGDRLKVIAERLQVSSPQLLAWLDEVAAHCPHEDAIEATALTDREKRALLTADGSLQKTPLETWAYIRTAVHSWELTRSGISIEEAARRLLENPTEITNRINQRTLFGVSTAERGTVLPEFQFTTTGLLPGLEAVLPAVPSETHPLGIVGFFNFPNPDLTLFDNAVSPTAWLLSGNPIEPVVDLARALEYFP
ncbi:hypothetical protein [Streptomyces sp. S1D4-20]|uniref:hypothetical protein n=1 Tax=Streptomyces sp. S1D4-20 TaxID=2594462 RepID=UPI0011637F3C|nr:hypothetical protein [Streptomyces sp. S1D4-20]QDN60093.1 hypothetical protein FNV67_36760 [Streptomyces sp. S1D4-20]